MSATSPRVSIVVTCHNLGQYLDDAIDSVFAQTFQDFEIVIVDDGSTEAGTVQLLSNYQRPRTRVVRIENRGLPGARNEGIRQTSGAYICTLDADDLLVPTYLEKSVAALDERPDIAFVSHWLRTFGDEEYEWTPRDAGFPALLDMNTINGAALVRRDAMVAAGLYDESMRRGCEDWDLWIGLVEKGLPGLILPEVLFLYRRRADSMSRLMMQGTTHVELYRYLIDKHKSSFEAHAVDLLIRREVDRANVLAETHDIVLDCAALLSEIEHLRDGVRLAGAKLQARDSWERAHRELQELREQTTRDRDAIAALEADLQERAERLEHSARHLAAMDAERLRDREGIEGLHFEIRMLRSSVSWRVTRPLRAVYSWLFERK